VSVCVVVCGTVHGSVREVYAACAAVLAVVCLVVYDSAAVRVWKYGSVRQCVAVPAVVCGSVWQCIAVHSTYMCTNKSLTIHLLVCTCTRSGGTEPHIPCILILTDWYVSERKIMRINMSLCELICVYRSANEFR
jgi:hypothetical protein